MIIDFVSHLEARQAQQAAIQAALDAQFAYARSQVRLEWVLADLLADIEAA